MARGRRRPRKGWKLAGDKTVNRTDLRTWLKEMSKWGSRVRADIRRLEKAARLAAGDPGDPPPPPE